MFFFFFSSRRRHTRFSRDWSSDVCSSDLHAPADAMATPSIAAVVPLRVGLASRGEVGSDVGEPGPVGRFDAVSPARAGPGVLPGGGVGPGDGRPQVFPHGSLRTPRAG